MTSSGKILELSEIKELLQEDELRELVCPYCETKFRQKRSNQKFCNEYCRKKARHKISVTTQRVLSERACEWCGDEIGEGKRKHAKFCSDRCRKEAAQSKVCVYCGLPGNTRDHFIPKAFAKRMESIGRIKQSDIIIPSCAECNSTANDGVFETIKSKRGYIKEQYRKKYRKLIDSPDWTYDEIADLGLSLRSHVRRSQEAKSIIMARLAWPRTK